MQSAIVKENPILASYLQPQQTNAFGLTFTQRGVSGNGGLTVQLDQNEYGAVSNN